MGQANTDARSRSRLNAGVVRVPDPLAYSPSAALIA